MSTELDPNTATKPQVVSLHVHSQLHVKWQAIRKQLGCPEPPASPGLGAFESYDGETVRYISAIQNNNVQLQLDVKSLQAERDGVPFGTFSAEQARRVHSGVQQAVKEIFEGIKEVSPTKMFFTYTTKLDPDLECECVMAYLRRAGYQARLITKDATNQTHDMRVTWFDLEKEGDQSND